MKTVSVMAGKTYRSRAVGKCQDQSGLVTDHHYSRGEGGKVSDLPTGLLWDETEVDVVLGTVQCYTDERFLYLICPLSSVCLPLMF